MAVEKANEKRMYWIALCGSLKKLVQVSHKLSSATDVKTYQVDRPHVLYLVACNAACTCNLESILQLLQLVP